MGNHMLQVHSQDTSVCTPFTAVSIMHVLGVRLTTCVQTLLQSITLEGQRIPDTVLLKMLSLQHIFIICLYSNHIHQCSSSFLQELAQKQWSCINDLNKYCPILFLSGMHKDTLAFTIQETYAFKTPLASGCNKCV